MKHGRNSNLNVINSKTFIINYSRADHVQRTSNNGSLNRGRRGATSTPPPKPRGRRKGRLWRKSR